MWLLIDADQNPATGWAGYDFIVNRGATRRENSGLKKTPAAGIGKKSRRWRGAFKATNCN